MAFIQHTNCPNCGSRDNLAEYSDGFYCFGCGYKKQKNDINSVRSRLSESRASVMQSDEQDISTTNIIPQKAMQWLLKYGITQKDIDIYKLGWCESWQALKFAAKSKRKAIPKFACSLVILWKTVVIVIAKANLFQRTLFNN